MHYLVFNLGKLDSVRIPHAIKGRTLNLKGVVQMTIKIGNSIWKDILAGTTGNAIADTIPFILEQKKREGYTVVVVDDFTGAILETL
jgi:hypothetical protein